MVVVAYAVPSWPVRAIAGADTACDSDASTGVWGTSAIGTMVRGAIDAAGNCATTADRTAAWVFARDSLATTGGGAGGAAVGSRDPATTTGASAGAAASGSLAGTGKGGDDGGRTGALGGGSKSRALSARCSGRGLGAAGTGTGTGTGTVAGRGKGISCGWGAGGRISTSCICKVCTTGSCESVGGIPTEKIAHRAAACSSSTNAPPGTRWANR